MDRGTWVATVFDQTYVWPRGEVVYVYGSVEYVRRMSGEVTDARPHRAVTVSRFANYDDFRQWCRAEGQPRTTPPALPIQPGARENRAVWPSAPHEKG